MKILKTIGLGLLIAVFGTFIAKDFIAQAAVSGGVQLVTGLPLKIKKLHIGLFNSVVDIEGFHLQNPKGFKDRTMVNIPKIYVDYNLGDIIGGLIHIEEIQFDLEEFVVVKQADGTVNLDSLKMAGAEEKAPEEKKDKPKGEMPEIQIDLMKLRINKAVFVEYKEGKEKPSIKKFPLNINEEYTDITDPNKLVSLIVVKALMGTTIGRLANVDLSGISSSVTDTLAGGKKLVGDVAGKATEELGKAADSAKQAADEAATKLKDATKDINMDAAKNLAGDATKDVGKAADAAAERTKEAAAAVGEGAKKLTGGLLGKVKTIGS